MKNINLNIYLSIYSFTMESPTNPFYKQISRRDFLKLTLLGASSLAWVGCSPGKREAPTTVEETPLSINLQKAEELLQETGVAESFSTSNPATMYERSKELAGYAGFSSNIWKIVHDQNGNELGVALDSTGETVPLRQGPDGRPTVIQGLDAEFVEQNNPESVFLFHDEQRNASFGAVAYGSSEVEKLTTLFQSNDMATKDMLRTLFAHSKSKLNLLHVPKNGMPNKPFIHPEFNKEEYYMAADVLPSAGVSGSTVTRYINETAIPTRNDIFLNIPRISLESNAKQIPYDAQFMGYLANEAYGIAVENYRIQNKLPSISGRFEAGSTGFDWAVTLQTMEEVPNALFTSNTTDFVKQVGLALK